MEYSDAAYEELLAEIAAGAPSFGSVGAAAYKPGLDRMLRMCSLMGEPQREFPCIHVAGTNGKGSTTNMLASVLACRGKRVGVYTSPHILDFRERMRVVREGGLSASGPVPDVELIPRRAVWDFMQQWGADVAALGLSYFEITTAMAFRWFADMDVDVAVIETGLGGRLDATNVVTPLLSVITNIGYDHMDILGSTLTEIATEKAGIIKPGVPVVIGERGEKSDAVFEAVAARCGAPLYFAQDWIGGCCDASSPGKNHCCAAGIPDIGAILPKMDLQGSYQRNNLTTVLCALGVMGIEADEYALEHAARICDFHARWELVRENPHTICDIGHNQHGLRYNFAQLEGLLEGGEYSDIVMVYGSVADKDVDAVLEILPARAYIYFTAADNHRAMPAAELAARYNSLTGKALYEVKPRVADAVEAALERCKRLEKPLLYVGGSTYVISEAWPLLKQA